jgi:hypothetical protein
MIADLEENPKIKNWHLWNVKSLVLQFFKILNSMTHRLEEACDKNVDNEDPMVFPIAETKQPSVMSMILCSFIMSFGVVLSADLQKIFVSIFDKYKKMFIIEMSQQTTTTASIFEIYFDVEHLVWEIISDKLEYKLKLGYYPKMSALLVPTPSIS